MPISIREFARRVQVDEKTVRDAVNKGLINKALRASPTGKRVLLDYSVALEEWNAAAVGYHSVYYMKKNGDPSKAVVDKNYLKAINAAAIFDAKLKELEYKEKVASLVDRQLVYDQLFVICSKVESAILSVPDQIADELTLITDRNKLHSALYEALAHTLEVLVEVHKREYRAKNDEMIAIDFRSAS